MLQETSFSAKLPISVAYFSSKNASSQRCFVQYVFNAAVRIFGGLEKCSLCFLMTENGLKSCCLFLLRCVGMPEKLLFVFIPQHWMSGSEVWMFFFAFMSLMSVG